jgi:hypothetical protein
MNQLQLPIPDYRRKGFSLLGHAISLFFKNALPIMFFVAIIAFPIEAIKNYYFFNAVERDGILPGSRMDHIVDLFFLCAITPMVVHFILGRMTGTVPNLSISLLWGVRKWMRMIVYNFLYSVIIFAGIIMLVIPGLLFVVWLMLLPIIVAIYDTSRINPLSVSRELARKRYFKFVGYALGGYGAIAVIGFTPPLLASFFWSESWITSTLVDVWLDWVTQLMTVVLLLVFLQARTEHSEKALQSVNSIQ